MFTGLSKKPIRTYAIIFLLLSLLFSSCSKPNTTEIDKMQPPSAEDTSVEQEIILEAPPAQSMVHDAAVKTPVPPSVTASPTIEDEVVAIPQSTPSLVPAPDEEEGLFCTLYINCSTIFSNTEKVSEEKLSIIPPNGEIYPLKEVEFNEGETVFNILLRETKKNKIHMEHVTTPGYGSSYIKGIGNIYEYDCGQLSGWTFKVNGEFPGISTSKYNLKKGDNIELLYSCDLGRDVGNTKGGLQ